MDSERAEQQRRRIRVVVVSEGCGDGRGSRPLDRYIGSVRYERVDAARRTKGSPRVKSHMPAIQIRVKPR